MANYTGGANTVCPFYMHEADKSITCEGLRETSLLMMRFRQREEKEAWQAEFCVKFSYDQCPVAWMLLQKYDAQAR